MNIKHLYALSTRAAAYRIKINEQLQKPESLSWLFYIQVLCKKGFQLCERALAALIFIFVYPHLHPL